jgi:hypothetical protein
MTSPTLTYGPGSGGPFFMTDLYAGDMTNPNFLAVASYPNMVGVVLKATQGTQYHPQWFTDNWPRALAAGGPRYGSSWFRGAYHFGVPTVNGATQADYFLDFIDKAGGLSFGDLPPIWDIEGAAWTSRQQIIDISSQFATRVIMRTGRAPILYAGALLRDTPVTSRMGFGKLWTPHLDMTKAGWPLTDYAMWQYAGDGKLYDPASAKYGFPLNIPGYGGEDMSVVLDNGQIARDLGRVRTILTGQTAGAGLSSNEILLITLASIAGLAGAIYFNRWLGHAELV